MPQDFVVTHGIAFHEFRILKSASSGPWKWLNLLLAGLMLAHRHVSHSCVGLLIVTECRLVFLEMVARPVITRDTLPQPGL